MIRWLVLALLLAATSVFAMRPNPLAVSTMVEDRRAMSHASATELDLEAKSLLMARYDRQADIVDPECKLYWRQRCIDLRNASIGENVGPKKVQPIVVHRPIQEPWMPGFFSYAFPHEQFNRFTP